MCGIAGFIGFYDNAGLALKANAIQHHRGPDNQSSWHDGYIALAHQRLSILDLNERSNQPFHKHGLVICFNGEIYNYKELRENLKKEKGVSFITEGDTEVVLEMYKMYGVACLEYFVGMFAFAIYEKNTATVFLARDHFGIKPLFYTTQQNAFAFSSELKTLLIIPGFNKSINAKALVSCLNYLWVSGAETMFNETFKLPPAHYLRYTKSKGIELVKYWELNDAVNGVPKREMPLANQLAEDIRLSVKRHMVADVPVSSFLSGGLDSSLIAVLAKKFNKNLSTYTISISNEDRNIERMPDDNKYAGFMADKYDFDHHSIKITPDILKELPEIVRILDEPIGDPAAINTYLICKEARKKGVKVLLSGMGADEIFFGYRRQKATLLSMKYNKLPAFIKSLVAGTVGMLPLQIFGRGSKFGRWSKRFMGFSSMPLEQAYMRSYSYYNSKQLQQLLTSEYWPAIDSINHEHKRVFDAKYKDDVVNQICNTDLSMFMLSLNLTYTDRASMAASVEVRVPFIDKLFLTQAMKIPGNMKMKNGTSKYILKRAAEKYLPKKIIYRPKASFGAPIRSWISNDLRPMVDDLLSKENILKRGFLNYEYVNSLIVNDRKGREDNAYQIYHLLTLELWCREYLDN